MEEWNSIRQRVLREGVSIRQIQRETGYHHKTVKRILSCSSPPPFVSPSRSKPKLAGYEARIVAILEAEKEDGLPQKQRHTAKRIFERLVEEGYAGGYTQVREAVRELRRTSQEVFVPLIHTPGEAQMDFGHALVKMNGRLVKAAFFVMVLPYSDAFFVAAYPRECTETFQDGHVRAFSFFEGVPRRISYDNARTCVSEIIGVHARKLTYGFLQLQSHYLFEEHFCRIRRPNEKGVVESIVKFTRLNFFVPVPEMGSFEELNEYLLRRCNEDLDRRVRGKSASKREMLKEDQGAFLKLPAAAFEACRTRSTQANRLSLVRFEDNEYSVPVRYAHHKVVVKGFVDKVRICGQDGVVAEHERTWGKEDIRFEPVHYLELLERKPGALDHAKPLQEWALPECFERLRERLQHEGAAQGTREYIRVLRLLERHSQARLAQAIQKAMKLRRCNHDVVAHYLHADDAAPVPTFTLEGREHLLGIQVDMPDMHAYRALLAITAN